MALLGIDFGLKKVGIALSQGEIASPVAIWPVRSFDDLIDKTLIYCRENDVEKIVIGLPEESRNSRELIGEIQKFAQQLEQLLHFPVFFEPEVFTSKTAQAKLLEAHKKRSRRQKDDDFAAALILQSFIDRTRS